MDEESPTDVMSTPTDAGEQPFAFMSYSARDKDFVDRLSADLRRAQINVWRDVERLTPGDDWQTDIARALDRAWVLLHVASANSGRSAWMQHEASAAFANSKRVIPVVIDNTGPENLPANLQSIESVDFREDYGKALARLITALRPHVTSKTPLAPESHKSKGYVFVSYAEEDHDFADRIRTFLEGRGYKFWDYAVSDRNYHGQLFLELEGVISDAAATLSILSEAWKRSPWTVKEYFFSEEVGVPVFLLKAKRLGPTLAIAGVPYIDFTKSESAGLEHLERELNRKNL